MILFSDIDGTLINFDGKVSPGVPEALRDWQQAGNDLYLTTGRTALGLWEAGKKLGLKDHVGVASNGSVMADCTPRGFGVRDINAYNKIDIVKQIIAVGDHKDLRFEDFNSKRYKIVEDRFGGDLWGESQLVDPLDLPSKGIVCIYIRVPQREGYEDKHVFEKDGDFWIQVSRPNVHKGVRVPNLITPTFFQRGRVPVIGVGDAENDIPLSQSVDRFFLMGNASQGLRNYVEPKGAVVLPSIHDGGVAYMIETLLKSQ